ncbi:excalibur calcium-binding domain-containing protein [Roseomonas chloroacetimidivorans]|uniref:excalibur calcium-binding domain-containing protein n=1 Tax=Roseomonas chloroacetimidivorans TaxID=1766656 RepID=UPI003C70D396
MRRRRQLRRALQYAPITVLLLLVGSYWASTSGQGSSAPWRFSGAQDVSSLTVEARHRLAARNCDTARAVGLAPAGRGEPGYWPHLDADNDGVACEPWPHSRSR